MILLDLLLLIIIAFFAIGWHHCYQGHVDLKMALADAYRVIEVKTELLNRNLPLKERTRELHFCTIQRNEAHSACRDAVVERNTALIERDEARRIAEKFHSKYLELYRETHTSRFI